MNKQRLFAAAGATAAGLGMVIMMPGIAQAHSSTQYTGNGSDRGGVTDSHHYVWACDTVADGHGVAIYYRTSNGGAVKSHSDYNGSASGGCGNKSLPSGQWVYDYKVCTKDVVCTGWVRS